MEQHIAALVGGLESGRITRRELIRSLSALVGAAALPSNAVAQQTAHPFRATGFNHVSFVVSDYARTRDFYADLLSLRVDEDDPKAKQCDLHLADGTYILARNPQRPNVTPPHETAYALAVTACLST